MTMRSKQRAAIFTSQQSAMLCFTRGKPIRLPDTDGDDLLDDIYSLSLDEKLNLPPDAPSEDEMQQRLKGLRKEISANKLDWYIVPSEDEHQSENLADSDKRREWISGFAGSAGVALIPSKDEDSRALLFVDSRYWTSAEQSIPKKNWEVRRVGAAGGSGRAGVIGGWIDFVFNEIPDGSRIGIDSKLISYDVAKTITDRLFYTKSDLVGIESNLVDKVHEPEARGDGPLSSYPASLSGETTANKLKRIRKVLTERARSDDWVYLLPTLNTIAWLLNYRCTSDVPFLPVAFAYCALTPASCEIFVDEEKLGDEELAKDWKEAGVQARPYGLKSLSKWVTKLVGDDKNLKIMGSKDCSWELVKLCEPAFVELLPCPVAEAMVLKNDVELQNFRNAYLRDGRAMVRWMAWLEQKILKEDKKIGEWAAAMVLTRFRRQEDMYVGPAYEDISATGPNAALAHYAPTRSSEAIIDVETPYVIDSGPQYLDATIDTTRTFFMGKSPSDDMKRAYTRVVQGHLAVAGATFPHSTDAFGVGQASRKFLWDDGLDFGHGLGHGIGNYGAVHEGPTGFTKGFSFKPGHVTTIEPGFYLEGQFGMRVESVYICKEVETKYEFGGKYLGFEGVTRVPIDTRLIDWGLMTKEEIKVLNDYNKSVEEALMPLLDDDLDKEAREWLKRMCKPKFTWPW